MASLIDAKTGKQIWTDDFPGKMENIFALQSDIAQKIAAALKVKLTPDQQNRISRIATTNIKALDVYNEALNRYINLSKGFVTSYEHSITENQEQYQKYLYTLKLCDNALALDSNMAEAYVLKAKVIYHNYQITNNSNRNVLLDSVFFLIKKALGLNNTDANAYLLAANYYDETGKQDSVFINLTKAYTLNPNDFEVNESMGHYYGVSNPEKSFSYFFRALRLDPQSVWTQRLYWGIGFEYQQICDFTNAEIYYKKAIESSDYNSSFTIVSLFWLGNLNLQLGRTDSVFKYSGELLKLKDTDALYQIAEAYVQRKDYNKANELYQQLWTTMKGDHVNEHRWAIALFKLGKKQQADQLFEKSFENYKKNAPVSYDLAGMYAFKGDKENAYKILRQFSWDWGSPYLAQHDPLFDNIRNDKEFKDILQNALNEKAAVRNRIKELQEKGKL